MTNDLYSQLLQDGEIRLLRWNIPVNEPHSSQNPQNIVSFELISTSIDTAPSFVALSYRWQAPDPVFPDAKIIVNGHLINIGESLYQLLLQASTSSFRVPHLWIDFICIQQSNELDKQRQIALMSQIYSKAFRVVIWLGTGDGESDAAIGCLLGLIDTLKGIDQALENGEKLTEFQEQVEEVLGGVWMSQEPIPMIEHIWKWFQREWFGRIWTLQEAALAVNSCIMMCGSKIIPYDSITHFVEKYVHDDPRTGHWTKLAAAIRPASAGHDPKNPPIPTMLHTKIVLEMKKALQNKNQSPANSTVINLLDRFRPLQCAEPRDRVLGAAAFLPAELISSLTNDVVLTAEQLYSKLAAITLEASAELHVLGAAGLAQHRRSNPARFGDYMTLPSWVPDWTYPKLHESLWVLNEEVRSSRGTHLYDTTPDTQAQVKTTTLSDGRQAACVKGIILDRVRHCSAPYEVFRMPAGWKLSEQPETLTESFKFVKSQIDSYIELANRDFRPSDIDVDDTSRLSAIRETIVGNIVPEVPSSTMAGLWIRARRPDQVDQMFEDFDGDCQRLARSEERRVNPAAQIPNLTKEEEEEDLARSKRPILQLSMATMCKGRCFFTTEESRIGIGPNVLEAGDQISIMYGGCTPFVVRRVLLDYDGEQLYELIGECYVHGLMNGEAMKIIDKPEEMICLV